MSCLPHGPTSSRVVSRHEFQLMRALRDQGRFFDARQRCIGRVAVLVGISIAGSFFDPCHAEELNRSAVAAEACATQGAPVRPRSEVEACGRWVQDRYSDKMLADYGILDVTKLVRAVP